MAPTTAKTAQPIRLGPGGFMRLAVFAGLLSGLAQIALMLVMRSLEAKAGTLGPHMVWMTPLATVGLFVVAALTLLALGRVMPRLRTPAAAIGTFGFLGVLGISLYKGGVHPLADATLAAGGASVLIRAFGHRVDSLLALAQRATPRLVGLVLILTAAVVGTPWLAEHLAMRRLGSPAARTNVILLVLDDVRAQSLGLYGHERPTSPNLERWAQRGVVFRRAVAPASWSLPSHAGMFTGRSPVELSADWVMPLDKRYPTLAEYLRSRGYLTAGFVANLVYCPRSWGLARGFMHYEDFPLSLAELAVSSKVILEVINSRFIRRLIHYHDFPGRKTAATINRDFLAWIDRRPARPFFAFLNYFDAHEPVVLDPEFERAFPFSVPRRWNILDYHLHQAARVNPSQLSPAEIEAEVRAYDAAVATLDRRIGELLEQLDRRGLLDSSVVFITADHGERFGEGGKFGHGGGLSRVLMHVPLIMLRPDRRAGMVEDFVSLQSLPATALDVAGIANNGTFPSCSLGQLARSGGPKSTAGCPVVTSAMHNRGKPWAAVYQGRFYLISGPRRQERLYDWDADPAESRNLVEDPEYQGVVAQMRLVADSLLAMGRLFKSRPELHWAAITGVGGP